MALVAIVGKPNVGKSSLFNRVIGRRKAIESDEAGTTRDLIFEIYQGKQLEIDLVDTGGISFEEGKNFEHDIKKQAEIAINGADTILFCVDVKDGVSQSDFEVANFLRRKTDPEKVFLIATKADFGIDDNQLAEIYSLGFDGEKIFTVSAAHNKGIKKMISSIEKNFLDRGFQDKQRDSEKGVQIALLGKPNAGKSSLLNAFLREEKLIVSDIPGTTIDNVDFEIKHEGEVFTMIDTAGIRRRKKSEKGLETLSVLKSISALDRSDVALLLIDSQLGATHQDQVILNYILKKKTGVIIVVNKWDEDEGGRFDATEDEKEDARKAFLRHLQSKFGFAKWASVVFVSAKTKKNVTKIFELAKNIYEERQKKIKTNILNQFLREACSKYSFPIKITFVQQVDICPPKFLFYCNNPDDMHFSAKRYMENRLRDAFGFNGTPIVMEFKQK
ncbi:MAG: ribosome biogenesis GTPase Der [Candidatus Gracilibacteria bacterium]|jgi:GTP-binding protein|nr:ribosome biogenesis GTPase Der [Candidatus Gracilibacteria bacterium]